MAVVGEAHVIVRAITNRVKPDIENAFKGITTIGEKAGRDLSDSVNRGLASGGGTRNSLFSEKFRKEADDARQKLDRLITTGYFLGPAFTALGGAIGAVGGGLLTLGATAAAVGAGGLTVLASGLTAAAQAAVTLKLAFSGVSQALSAGLKAQKSTISNTKAIAAADRRLEDARVRLKRLQEEAKPELLAQLTKRQADAEENYADAVISSTRSQRAYRDAQENTRNTVKKLIQAREEAVEKLQQLRFEVEGGAISEKRARLEFIKAREALQRVQDLPPNSRARQEAELAFAEADLNLRKAIDRNSDLRKAETAQAAVVQKDKQTTIDKTIEYRNALEAEADAQIDYAKSLKAVKDAEIAKNQATAEASGDPNKSKAVRDINRQIADAARDVADAEKDLADARKGSGFDAYQDALNDLSPAAQEFVKYLISIQDEFKKLKTAAGEELFPKLEIAIQNLVDNLFPRLIPLLQGTGGVLGDIAIDFSNAVTEGTNLTNLETVWKNNDDLLRKVGKGASGFYGGLLALLAAAEPLIVKFGDWIQRLGETFDKTMKAKQATGELTEFFENISRISSGLGDAFKTGFSALGDIIANVIAPGGSADLFIQWLDKVTGRWKEFTEGGADNTQLTTFLNGLTTNFTKILDLIGNIIGEAAKIGATEGFGEFVDRLNDAVDIFGEVGTELSDTLPSLGELVVSFAEFTKLLTESGAIKIFFDTLKIILDVFNGFLKLPGVSTLLALAGGAFAIVRAFRLAGKAIGFVGKAIFGNIQAYRRTIDNLGTLQARSYRAAIALKGATGAAKIKRVALIGLGKAAGIAGRALSLVGGPLGLLLLLAPLIIENWDKIVAFFKDFGPKVVGFFQEMGKKIGEFFTNLGTSISDWFTKDFIPFLQGLPKKFISAVAGFWGWIVDLLGGLFKSIGDWFSKTLVPFLLGIPATYIRLVSGFWGWIFDLLGTLFTNIGNWFSNTLLPWLKDTPNRFIRNVSNFWSWITDLLGGAFKAISDYFTNTVAPFIAGLPKRFADGAKAVWDFLSKGVKSAWDATTKFFTQDIPNFLKSLPSRFTSSAGKIWGFLSDGLKSAWQSAKDWWNANIAGKGFTLGGFKIGNYQVPKFDIRVPKLAMGGIVPATQGGVLAQLAEAGRPERVEPLDPDGLSKRDKAMIDYLSGGAGKGVTVNVYPSAGMDERELANLVSRQLAYQMRRGAA